MTAPERLDDAEREALWRVRSDAALPVGGFSIVLDPLERAVERIVAQHVARAVAEARPQHRAEALREAADEVDRVERIGTTPTSNATAEELGWFATHPLRNVSGWLRHRPIVADWLRARADREGQS